MSKPVDGAHVQLATWVPKAISEKLTARAAAEKCRKKDVVTAALSAYLDPEREPRSDVEAEDPDGRG